MLGWDFTYIGIIMKEKELFKEIWCWDGILHIGTMRKETSFKRIVFKEIGRYD